MKIDTKAARLIAVCCGLLMLSAAALAYPGGLNLIPTTDVLAANSFRLGYEADGPDQPFDTGYTEYIYSQFGVTDRLEVGLDVYDVDGASMEYFNAKYLLTSENGSTPAVAAGTMLVGSDSKPSFYAVGSRSCMGGRLHFGVQNQSDRTWGLFGVDYPISEQFFLLADYQTGRGLYHTVGIYWQQSDSLGATVYFVRNNTASLRDSGDYVGLNLAYTWAL